MGVSIMADKFVVDLTCAGGHKQTITYEGLTRQAVELNIALLTGDPSIYKYPPDDDSMIGKCAYPDCGRKVTAVIRPNDVHEAALKGFKS